MPAKMHVCLDTNILIRVVTQGQPGCELDHLKELEAMVEKSSVVLLVPEIVKLEFDKEMRAIKDNICNAFRDLKAAIPGAFRKAMDWNEMDDVSGEVEKNLQVIEANKNQKAEEHKNHVGKLLDCSKAVQLPLTHNALLAAKRRMIAGRMPSKDKKNHLIESDCCIVELLIDFFAKTNSTEAGLLICTENVTDFGVILDEKAKKTALHPLISENLPTAELFTDLNSLVQFLKEQKPIVEPPSDEVEKAIERKASQWNDWFATAFKDRSQRFPNQRQPLSPDQLTPMREMSHAILAITSYRDAIFSNLRHLRETRAFTQGRLLAARASGSEPDKEEELRKEVDRLADEIEVALGNLLERERELQFHQRLLDTFMQEHNLM